MPDIEAKNGNTKVSKVTNRHLQPLNGFGFASTKREYQGARKGDRIRCNKGKMSVSEGRADSESSKGKKNESGEDEPIKATAGPVI